MKIKKDILLVEDDKRVLSLLATHLENDFVIHKARTAAETERLLKKKHIDGVCLDLILPDTNGFSLCTEIKKQYPSIKVLILTKRLDLDARLQSFKLGADDYLSKPFFPEELSARLKNLFNERSSIPEVIFYKGLQLEPETNKISFNKIGVILSRNEFLIMEFLMKGQGIKSSESIIKYLSTKLQREINVKSLIVGMTRLRSKFERNTGMRIVKTRYGKGYYIGL